ncbi:MAG: 4-alpha-glucanotransferase [Pseudomonadota bacterium]
MYKNNTISGCFSQQPSKSIIDLKSHKRRAGILLHPTSLPADFHQGDIGPAAHHFIDFLSDCGFSVWQMLPLGPTHGNMASPYQTLSTHAGSTDLISPILMSDRGWIDIKQFSLEQKQSQQFRSICIHQSYKKVSSSTTDSESLHKDYQLFLSFCELHKNWLDDYALFIAIREEHLLQGWTQWPKGLRNRKARALKDFSEKFADKINCIKFIQFTFFMQWQQLRDYAHSKSIALFGDLPIFVAHDSADVWANRESFHLDEEGNPSVVAGVPPDYFSETGQLWGNPLYNWQHMQSNNFSWWKDRIQSQRYLYDLIRIDHFRGLQAYWEIPADSETAINGHWVEAPGNMLLAELFNTFDQLNLIAEDLGVITDEVEELRDKYHLPGMKILQFAFSYDAKNPYLPHNHCECGVVYTGTHDNDTSLAWANSLNENDIRYIHSYFNSTLPVHELLKYAALASVTKLAILPMQDFLNLGDGNRMNTPGTIENNWQWGFKWEQLDESTTEAMKHLLALYGRN